ncbi:MAG: M2 family metallopeptidase, partial [Vicinamibacteria bacterium]
MKLILPTFAAGLLFTGATSSAAETASDVKAFLERAEAELAEAWIDEGRASWVQSTYITHDTEILAAEAAEKSTALAVALAQEATRFQGLELPEDMSRKLLLLKLALVVPAPR